MKKQALFTGLVTGITAGVISTLLNTPKTGREARQDFKTKQASAKLSLAELKDSAMEVKASVQRLVDTAKQEIPEKVNSIKVDAGLWKESIEPNKQALQKEIKNIQSTVGEMQEALPQQSSGK